MYQRPKKGTAVLNIHLPAKLRKEFKKICVEEDRTMSQAITLMIRQKVEHEKTKFTHD